MNSILLWTLIISLFLNAIFFAIAYKLQSDKFTDLTYSITFIFISIFDYYHSESNAFATVGVLLIVIWALRLGGFLLYRVIKNGKDSRFDVIRNNFTNFGKFWLGQAIVAWILMIPISISINDSKNFNALSYAGILVWALGLIIETTADYQKLLFNLDNKNKNMWISTGIWRNARHPNYFGEMLVWVGIYIYTVPVLNLSAKFIGLLSPVLIIALLRFGSGVPILEKIADKKWGNNRKYKEYKQRTNLLFPIKTKL